MVSPRASRSGNHRIAWTLIHALSWLVRPAIAVQTLGNSLSEHPGIDLASVIGKRLLQDAAAKEILPGVGASSELIGQDSIRRLRSRAARRKDKAAARFGYKRRASNTCGGMAHGFNLPGGDPKASTVPLSSMLMRRLPIHLGAGRGCSLRSVVRLPRSLAGGSTLSGQ